MNIWIVFKYHLNIIWLFLIWGHVNWNKPGTLGGTVQSRLNRETDQLEHIKGEEWILGACSLTELKTLIQCHPTALFVQALQLPDQSLAAVLALHLLDLLCVFSLLSHTALRYVSLLLRRYISQGVVPMHIYYLPGKDSWGRFHKPSSG